MTRNLLYLLGGSAAFDTVAEEFVPAAGGRGATIALLMQGGDNWQKYVPDYVEPWERRGVTCHHPIVPDESGALDLHKVAAALRNATGIFIGGGYTPTYHRLYATEPVRSLIRQRYQAGVPVAGVSAGALIAPDVCVLARDEAADGMLRIEEGLGLARDLVVEVHFSELDRLPYLLDAMTRLQASVGWGIDEPACMVLEDGRVKRVLGQSVYKVVMADFESGTHQIAEYVLS